MKKTFEDLEREFAAAAKEANELKAERDELKRLLAEEAQEKAEARAVCKKLSEEKFSEKCRADKAEAENRTLWQVIELMAGGERK